MHRGLDHRFNRKKSAFPFELTNQPETSFHTMANSMLRISTPLLPTASPLVPRRRFEECLGSTLNFSFFPFLSHLFSRSSTSRFTFSPISGRLELQPASRFIVAADEPRCRGRTDITTVLARIDKRCWGGGSSGLGSSIRAKRSRLTIGKESWYLKKREEERERRWFRSIFSRSIVSDALQILLINGYR